MKKIFFVCLTISLVGMVCTLVPPSVKPVDYNEIVLDYNRSNFGNAPFPFWLHLTSFEIRTLQNVEKAKAADPEALLALALIASGNVRDSALFLKYQERISRFIAKIRPAIESEKDYWQKGFKLYQSMRREFMPLDSAKDLAGYDWYQSRLAGIFENNMYNCVSSSMLYIICARYFGMKVQGVVMPSHVFAQLESDNGKRIEIETTSKTGFDWIHDEQYYKTKSTLWFQARGLQEVTYADYLKRRIMEPYQLMCYNMTNQHTDARRMHIEDIHRLKEIQAFVETDNADYQKERLVVYQADFAYLQKKKDYATARRLFQCVDPVVAAAQKAFPKDTAIANVIARFYCNRNSLFSEIKNYDDFFNSTKTTLEAIRHATFDTVDLYANCLSNAFNSIKYCVENEEFDKAEKLSDLILPYTPHAGWLVQNLQWALGTEMQYQWGKRNWQEVIRICKKQLTIDRDGKNVKIIGGNLEGAYCNWSNSYANEGNWPKARETLKKCENDTIPGQSQCSKFLQELENAHSF